MKTGRYLLIFACFVPLLLFRDFTPNNELKYLSIANEAMRDGTLFTFRNHGIPYADKPPLYFWLIMFAKWLSGDHYMFLLGLLSLIPALCILYVMDKWVKTFLSSAYRTGSQLMLITTALFTGSALVLRMDMLMCLFIVLSLYTFYKLYSGQAKPSDPFKLPVYIFLALFTKGPAGLFIPLLSITLFLVFKKQLRTFGRYMGKKQGLILLLLFSVWMAGVYFEGGKEYLNNLLFHQTLDRAVDSFHHQEPFWYYLKTMWYAFAPWSIFYITVLIIGIQKHLINNDLKQFFLIIITSTFISLSLFSGKLDIYLLPIYPFITYLCFLLLPELKTKKIRFSVLIPAILFLMAFPACFFIRSFTEFTFPAPILYSIAGILSFTALLCLYFLWKKTLIYATNVLSVGLLLSILTSGIFVYKIAPYIGWKEICQKAKTIAEEKGISLFHYYRFRSGENLDVYLNQNISQITIEELSLLSEKQNFITFVRNKDLIKEEKLQKLIKQKPLYTVGNYSFIVF